MGGDHYAPVPPSPLVRAPSLVQSPPARACLEAAARWVPYVMLCKSPYMTPDGSAFGCGQCQPCRINKRRVWTHRILLEAGLYEENAFVTLTYADDRLPGNGSVIPRDAQLFLKKLRFHLRPSRLRFYLVGEYGSATHRPHYHLALFNYPACRNGFTQYRRGELRCCAPCVGIQRIWTMGNVYIGRLEPDSAAYIAGYVTKKMTRADDVRLDGRHPEFARMSLRPGIGAEAMHELGSVVLDYEDDFAEDVPSALRHGNKILPLGRYLTRRLRALSGRGMNAPPETIAALRQKMQHLRETATEISGIPGVRDFKTEVLKKLYLAENQGRFDQAAKREKLWRKREKI